MYSKLFQFLRQKTTLAAIVASTAVSGCVSLYAPVDGLSIKVPKTAQVNQDLRKKLAFIENVKKMGVERFGLKESPHYSEYNDGSIPIDTLYLLVVTSPTILPSRQGNSIFIDTDQEYREALQGYVFFYSNADKLEDEKEYYQKQGYDIYRRSTTNFNDGERGCPITKDFLQRNKVNQAQTIFHEDCHYWVDKEIGEDFSSELNESFCTVVGYAGTVNYFSGKEGKDSPDYQFAVDSFQWHQWYAQEINSYYSRLQEIYTNPKLILEEKLKQREAVFKDAEGSLGEKINNAVLLDRYPYTKYFHLMLKFHDENGENLRITLEKMKDCPEAEQGALEFIVKNSK